MEGVGVEMVVEKGGNRGGGGVKTRHQITKLL